MSYDQTIGGPGYPGVPGPTPAGAPPARGRTAVIIVSIVAAFALIAAVIAVVLVLTESSSAADEVFLEAAAQPGPDPFTTSVAVAPLPSTTTTTTPPTTAGGANTVNSRTGSQPGLYGGTQNNASCDPQQMVAFLEANPDKAVAWVQALNSDPTLRWSGGNQVQVAQIRAFVKELTPVNLTVDTRVTNYGFADGKPTPRQAVLERGTAVLVDAFGVPRTKCGCGNPLTKPVAAKGVKYQGTAWSGWSPTTVVVVQQTTVVIETFVLVELAGGGYIDRPAGTTGDQDTPSTFTGGDTTPSTAPPATSSTLPPTTETVPPSTLQPADFCATFLEIQARWAEVDEPTDMMLQQFSVDFATLTAAAPAEIRADMEAMNAWVQSWIGSGDLAAEMPADVQVSSDNVEAYITGVCGITIE